MRDHPTNLPKSFQDMIALAEVYLARLYETQEVVDLYPAVLSTVHVADWFVEGTLHQELESWRGALTQRFPEWASLRDFTNGLKHAVRTNLKKPTAARLLKAEKTSVEWEHIDGWDHAGSDKEVWQIEHNCELRSIYSLCRIFLDEFQTWAAPQITGSTIGAEK